MWTPHETSRTRHIDAWNDWADAQLQNGDIVFMRGDCYLLMGTVNFSQLCADITDSRFSHIGLVAIENGQAHVYDLRSKGCLRTRFGELVSDRQLHQMAIKRHRSATAEERQQMAEFCRTVYRRHEPYDHDLKPDDSRLYCTELVEYAYRSVGYSLSESVAIQDLPHYAGHTKTMQFARTVTAIEPDQPVLIPGNEQIGVWANPDLELVLDLPDVKVLP